MANAVRHSTFLIAAGAVGLAAIASFHHDLAIDEPFTALAVAHPSTLGATLVHDNVPLYYVLLLGWSRLFGQSAFALRALSMAAFAGAILFSAAAARSVVALNSRGGEDGPALTAAFVACSVTFGLQPAATARPYALVMMLAAMAVWAAVREARFLLFAAHLFGLFAHPVFIFFSVAFAAAGIAFGRWRRLLAVTPLVALGIYLVTWGARLGRTAALPTTSWMPRPALADVVSGLLFWGDRATPILAIVIFVLIVGRGPDRIRGRAGAAAFLLMLTALTLVGTIGVSAVRPVYLASRTPVLVLPAVAVACGVLAAELGGRLATVALVGLVGVSAVRFTVK
ncbi:MAG TPA: hypothetical protein VH138_12120, partial [Vicinamibacterales bacterium]|nr:hypothetical protein [Vicinamibacterales bacterium]